MNIVITGSNSGLGAALMEALVGAGHACVGYDLRDGRDVRCSAHAEAFFSQHPNTDVLINNAGVNGLDWLHSLTEERWATIMDTNAKGIYVMSRAAAPILVHRKGTIINIVSNAAHVPMRASLAYNASKGAAHIMTLQLARELAPDVTVFGVAPNRLAETEMTDLIDSECARVRGWSLEEALAYERKTSLVGERTPPHLIAALVTHLVQSKEHHKYLTGCILPYGA